MGGEEHLQRSSGLLGAEGAQEPRDAVRLQPVLQFVREHDRRLTGRLALQASDKQTRGPDAQAAKRDAAFVVQGDGAATERHRMRIQQRLGFGADVDAQFLSSGGDDPQRFSQLLFGLVSEGTARIPCGLDQSG